MARFLAIVLLLCVAYRISAEDSYAPSTVKCPSSAIVRTVSKTTKDASISGREQDWLSQRETITRQAWIEYLNNVNIQGFDVNAFTSRVKLPRVAIAASGGGYRSMLNVAGVISSFDFRNSNAKSKKTGGILQLNTYFSALSGGAWFLSSWSDRQYVTVSQLRKEWNLDDNLYTPGDSTTETLSIYDDFQDQIEDKEDAGFEVSLVDLWGRAVSYQLYDDTGLGTEWSELSSNSLFASHQVPFPIQVVNQVFDEKDNDDSNVWEWNVYESGSFQNNIAAFVETQYLGTKLDKGVVRDKDECVKGFDNIGWITGTSSSAFVNAFSCDLLGLNLDSDFLTDLVSGILDLFGFDTECDSSDDTFRISDGGVLPNPFRNLGGVESRTRGASKLFFGDGGLDGQNIPLFPLLIPSRGVNVILAIDSSADTDDNWPNGVSLSETADFANANGVPFPTIPSRKDLTTEEDFVNRMTFFGCLDDERTPTIVYLPNHRVSEKSNYSTFKVEYSDKEVDGVIKNGFDQWTEDNIPTCLACALVYGGKVNTTSNSIPAVCRSCFETHCWPKVQFASSTKASSSPSSPKPSSSVASKSASNPSTRSASIAASKSASTPATKSTSVAPSKSRAPASASPTNTPAPSPSAPPSRQPSSRQPPSRKRSSRKRSSRKPSSRKPSSRQASLQKPASDSLQKPDSDSTSKSNSRSDSKPKSRQSSAASTPVAPFLILASLVTFLCLN